MDEIDAAVEEFEDALAVSPPRPPSSESEPHEPGTTSPDRRVAPVTASRLEALQALARAEGVKAAAARAEQARAEAEERAVDAELAQMHREAVAVAQSCEGYESNQGTRRCRRHRGKQSELAVALAQDSSRAGETREGPPVTHRAQLQSELLGAVPSPSSSDGSPNAGGIRGRSMPVRLAQADRKVQTLLAIWDKQQRRRSPD